MIKYTLITILCYLALCSGIAAQDEIINIRSVNIFGNESIEKRELMCEAFNNTDIQQQLTIKMALDPNSLLNPGKVYPILRKCAEEGRVHVHGGKTKFPDIPRF